MAIRVFDCELPKPIRHVFGTPFGLTVFPYSVPQRIDIIDRKILRCRSVGRPKVRVVHEHDGNAVTAEAAPPLRLARSPESQDRFVPGDRLAHVLRLKHWYQLSK